MKAKKLAALLLTLVLALGLIPVGAMAAQTTVTPTSKASITVNNAVANDVFAAYKVIDITYDAGNNTLTKEWNSAFANYFSGTTIEQFAALKDESHAQDLKNLLADLPQYIVTNNIDPVQTKTVTGTTATFADLAMGEYFIRPTSTTSVYQLMLQKIEPTVANVGGVQTYVIDDVTFNAKHKEVNVAKTANKTSVTKNEKVAYTITVDIPTYLDDVATDKSFKVYDKLPDGLTIDPASIEVKVNDAVVSTTAYTLDTTATNDYTFKLSVSNDQYTNWKANAGKQLVITYTATLNDNGTTAVNTDETNTVTFDYSNYPYVNSHVKKTASVDVTTFAIKVNKYDASNHDKKLANAEFDLYRTAYDGEIEGVVTIPHTTDVKGKLLEHGVTAGVDGTYTFEKYEANGIKYKYYLVETKAPSGYNLLTDPIEVSFTDENVDVNGVYTVDVENSSGIQLPITGGTGTIIFTVIGIALMAGAVVLLVFSRKKAKTDGNK